MAAGQAARLGVGPSALDRLVSAGRVSKFDATIRRIPLHAPVYDSARDGRLDARALERKLRARFVGQRRELYTVFYSEPFSATRVEHEVHLTDVYLACRTEHPDLAWISEKSVSELFGARGGVVIPDAALADADGNIVTFIDYVSEYRSPRLTALYVWAERHGIPIQFW